MKKILYLVSTVIIAVLSWGVFIHKPASEAASAPISVKNVSLFATTTDPFKEKVSRMILDEKIGQMMIIGFDKPYADAHIKEMIQKYHVGGVNLLRRNVGTKAQILKMTADLNILNASSTDIPFMIATDQEGGAFSRFATLSYLKPQTKLTATTSAYIEALGRGKELAKLGVTLDFSPVVDYVTDKKSYLYARTFATTTDATVPLAEAMLKGYSDAGIQGTIKHFPGYGNIADDPHRNTAGSKDVSLYEKGLEPFKRLLQNKSDGAVMTAHIVIPGIDTKPATFSVYFLKDLLRKQWNYQGVIITDDLEMTSAGKKSIPDLAVEAVQAGNDMIISTPTASVHAKIHGAIKKAVLEGKIPLADIDASVERILRFKGYQLKR